MTLAETVRAALSDTQIVALTIWGEARGEPIEGQIAVGCVIRNRMKGGHWGRSYTDVCLAKWQFSCWLEAGGAENYAAMTQRVERLLRGDSEPAGSLYDQCEYVAHGIIEGRLRDNVKGAVNYYAPLAMIPEGRMPPWAIGLAPVVEIGAHRFYRLGVDDGTRPV